MSVSSASGGASALNGSAWTIVRAARESVTSEVSIGELRVAVVVERADALGAVGVHGRAPVGIHHDRDGLLDRLAFAQAHGALDGLHGGGGVAGDLPRDPQGRGPQLAGRVQFVDHAEPV